MIDQIIDDIRRKRLQHLVQDEQISNGFDSSSQNISISHKYLELFDTSLLENCKNRPQFDPSYESPLEEMFAWNIIKYLDKTVTFQKQVSIDTLCGRFRLDFMIQKSGISIGLECDGKEYHSPLRDEWRDAMILETGLVTAIYRFRGKDLFSNIEDCLFFLALWEPQFFSERGHVCLKTLASDEARAKICQLELDERDHIFCGYKQYKYEYGINIERHSCLCEFLNEKSSFAKEHGGGKLDHLMEKFDAERTVRRLIF